MGQEWSRQGVPVPGQEDLPVLVKQGCIDRPRMEPQGVPVPGQKDLPVLEKQGCIDIARMEQQGMLVPVQKELLILVKQGSTMRVARRPQNDQEQHG
jgi:hypothetical protein